MRPLIPFRLFILPLASILLLTACTIGPIELNWRNAVGNQPAQMAPSISQTVTAVFATNTAIAALRTATAAAPPSNPGVSVQATQPAPTTASQPLRGDLRLIYSLDAFTLVNTSNRARDISGLSFHSTSGELTMANWDNGYLTASLYSFPPGDCLMAWGLGTDLQDRPVDCATRHAWIAVNTQQIFWQSTDSFGVRWYGQPIGECRANAALCDINLP